MEKLLSLPSILASIILLPKNTEKSKHFSISWLKFIAYKKFNVKN